MSEATTRQWLIMVAFVLSGMLCIGVTCFEAGKKTADNWWQSHARPNSGAVQIGRGVFCSVDGQTWQPAHEISDGSYICFPSPEGAIEQ